MTSREYNSISHDGIPIILENDHDIHSRVNNDVNDNDDDELRLQSAYYMVHLHSLLIKTKYENDLNIRAVNIPRLENVCADALADLNVEAFKRYAVEHPTSEEPKKVKQLSFLPAFQIFPLISPAY